MKSGEEVLTRLAFWVQAGHDHSGMDSIAMDGASNVNVPPWRMGSLEIKRSNGKELEARQICQAGSIYSTYRYHYVRCPAR